MLYNYGSRGISNHGFFGGSNMKKYIRSNKEVMKIEIPVVFIFNYDPEGVFAKHQIFGTDSAAQIDSENFTPEELEEYFELYENEEDESRRSDTPPIRTYELSDIQQEFFNNYLGYVDGLLRKYRFEIKEHHPSNRSNSSYYFSFFGADSEHNVSYDTLYLLRISAHVLDNQRSPINYYRRVADTYKTPTSKADGEQGYEPLVFIIGAENRKNYREACQDFKNDIVLDIVRTCDEENN